MNIRRFLIEPFKEPSAMGSTLSIVGDEYHHLKNVNRAQIGDRVELIDGQGALFCGTIRALKTREALVDIDKEQRTTQPPVHITIAPSLLKQRPMGFLIEKLAELGVDEIRPLIFSRTDEKYSVSRVKKWQKIADLSLKVNKKLWNTPVYEPVYLPQFINQSVGAYKTRILLDIGGDTPFPQLWQFPAIVVIGPPGDFTHEEREQLLNSGFLRYNINDSVLKSETAAISITAILKAAAVNHHRLG
jgi:16S rRNA (uracil1498-N3)-methyltransferase